MKYLRRIALGLVLLVVLVPLLILAVIFVVYHRAEPLEAGNSDPPGQGIIIAETALPGDDAIPRLAELVAPINDVVKSQDCLGLKTSRSVDWDCVNAVLKDGTTTLLAFEEWRSGPSLYKLQRPQDLGNHIRVPGLCFCADAPTPDWRTFPTLVQLLGYRSLKRLSEGNYEEARDDLHAIFLLGAFLQQNPLVVEHLIAISVYKFGVALIAKHVPPKALTPDYASLLPESKLQLDAMRFAFGAEWQGMHETLKRELPKYAGHEWFNLKEQGFQMTGIYDEQHTLRLIAKPMRYALGHLDRGVLASPSPGSQFDIDEPCPKGILWLRNPLGRVLACVASIDWTKYNARTGQSIDKIEATRVVIAARLFMRDQHRWPVQVEDLVPTYLKAWPLSALDGKPLRWLKDKDGVQVMGPDGVSPCKDNEFCEFPFEPSEAIMPATGTKPI